MKLASNLIRSGFEVVGHSRTKKEEFLQEGGIWADSVQSLARSADVIIHSLPSVEVLAATVDRELEVVRRGQIVIDLSSYPVKDKMAQASRLARREVVMLDCEISGLPNMVADRTAVIFQSGDKAAVDSAEDVFAAMADRIFYLGEFGVATKMKLLANAMVFVHNMMGAEILNLAGRAGVDPKLAFEILKNSAGGSSTFSNKAPIMLSRDFDDGAGPFRHMFHFLKRVSDLAEESGAATPLIATAQVFCRQAEAEGRHDQDIAAMIELLENSGRYESGESPLRKEDNHG